ncbi:MAG: hypothetical protein R3C13_04510 [Hyphomonas sp.]|uniref:hypothetical protein n=1 Tax=Hyphomonas sp. TaxID=87 RepID=UPI003527147F
MRLKTILVLAPVLALGLSACDQILNRAPDEPPAAPAEQAEPLTVTDAPPTTEFPVRPEALANEATIDWMAARADVASSSGGASGSFDIASGEEAPPVPVMLPTGIVIPQGAESEVKFQPLSDGYFAFYPGTAYNIVVNGTNEVIGERTDSSDSEMHFIPTMTGAQVAFTKYGADYLVEFECTASEGDNPDCISEEEALTVADSLIAVRSR